MGFAIGLLAVGIGVIGYWHRQTGARRELAHRAVPSSFLGKVSLWLLLAGLLMGPFSRVEGPVAVSFLDGLVPLGLIAFVLVIVAFTKYHDRGLLLLGPLVGGLVLIATLVALAAA
jgi:hypothetical protein